MIFFIFYIMRMNIYKKSKIKSKLVNIYKKRKNYLFNILKYKILALYIILIICLCIFIYLYLLIIYNFIYNDIETIYDDDHQVSLFHYLALIISVYPIMYY
jgi:hypothetical protein